MRSTSHFDQVLWKALFGKVSCWVVLLVLVSRGEQCFVSFYNDLFEHKFNLLSRWESHLPTAFADGGMFIDKLCYRCVVMSSLALSFIFIFFCLILIYFPITLKFSVDYFNTSTQKGESLSLSRSQSSLADVGDGKLAALFHHSPPPPSSSFSSIV